MSVGGVGAFAGGLAAGYFKTREDQRAQQHLALMKQLIDLRLKNGQEAADAIKGAQADFAKRMAAQAGGRAGPVAAAGLAGDAGDPAGPGVPPPQMAPTAVQPNGLAPGPAAVQPLPVGPQSGQADAGPSAGAAMGSNAHTAQMIAEFGGPKYHDLAAAIDPTFSPALDMAGATPASVVGPAAGLDAGALGGALGGTP